MDMKCSFIISAKIEPEWCISDRVEPFNQQKVGQFVYFSECFFDSIRLLTKDISLGQLDDLEC